MGHGYSKRERDDLRKQIDDFIQHFKESGGFEQLGVSILERTKRL